MAEGLMRKHLRDVGKNDIEVRSAGVVAPENFAPTKETIDVMKKEGIDVSDHRSKKITEQFLREADLVLVMEDMHKQFLKDTFPGIRSKIHLLKEYGITGERNYPKNTDIPDPIGRPAEYYTLSFQMIKDQVERIAKLL